ncbi:MAG: lytic murein transglycosylase, partial [Pseudoruegeria sp.]
MYSVRAVFGLTGVILALSSTLAFGAGGAVETSLRPAQRSIQTLDNNKLELSRRPAQRGDAFVTQVATSNAGFDRWIAGFYGRAQAKGISKSTLEKAFRGVKYNSSVIAKDRNQSEFTRQIWDYLDSAASPTRVKNGKSALKKHRRTLDKIEKAYGVDRDVVVAIWGLESAYGEHRGDIRVIEAVATLAYDGRRGKFFEQQLIAALKILQNGDVSASKMKGSWAGAMGHTQFIPTSYEAFAVDFTGDGKRDIWSNDPTDSLASTAQYLRKSGWIKGQPWGVEVRLPKGFNYGSASRKNLKSPAAWAQLGVVGINGKPVPNYGSGSILLPAGASGAAF